ncbi:thiosulfate/3-mercaptopyruvate sulfurtransferase [Frigoribacterium sp. 2355]
MRNLDGADQRRSYAAGHHASPGVGSTPTPAQGDTMAVEHDTSARFGEYAHPERLVGTEWLQQHLGTPGLVVVESDEDVLLYETGHIAGAVKIDWHLDLNDPVQRDYVDGEGFAALMSRSGITRDSTVVIYGDKNNWWAAYALWVFSLFGHEDVRLLDGGRAKWEAEGRDYTTEAPEVEATDYPVVERDDSVIRAYKDDVLAHLGKPLIDVRSPEEFSGQRTTAPAYPDEGALRAGHIPSAQNVPWGKAAADDGTFRPLAELDAIYRDGAGLSDGDEVVAYCRIGERSSHTWFVLTHLMGFEDVRNYDGSWTEWGSAVRVPIVQGTEPGEVPAR